MFDLPEALSGAEAIEAMPDAVPRPASAAEMVKRVRLENHQRAGGAGSPIVLKVKMSRSQAEAG
jgi:hypothetical protein